MQLSRVVGAISIWCLIAACGGSVLRNPDETATGSAGAGAGNSGTTGTTGDTSGGPGPQPASGSGPTPPGVDALCEQQCQQLLAHGCTRDDGGCMQSCLDNLAYFGPCKNQYLFLLGCVIDNFARCGDSPGECAQEEAVVEECKGQCNSAMCNSNNGEGCFCHSSCGFDVDCTWDSNGGASCACSFGGSVIGRCEEPSSVKCDLHQSCCSQFF